MPVQIDPSALTALVFLVAALAVFALAALLVGADSRSSRPGPWI